MGQGSGSITGQVIWNGQPYANAQVELWQKDPTADYQGLAATTADAMGFFSFGGLAAGDYRTKFYAAQGAVNGYPGQKAVTLAKRQAADVGIIKAIKGDLVLISPFLGETISANPPTLSWEPYPSVITYNVVIDDHK